MSDTLPLVSCIMPTYNRHNYMLRSIKYFLNQDYPNKELIIVDDTSIDLKINNFEKSIKYLHYNKKYNVGKKRNIAIQNAKGSIIMFWDDDDIYANDRINVQVSDIISKKCDITVFNNIYYHINNKLYITDKKTHENIWYNGYACGTLTFRKSITNKCKFKNINLAEDVTFLKCALEKGYKLHTLKNNYKFVYTKHSNNTFVFDAKFKQIRMPKKIEKLI